MNPRVFVFLLLLIVNFAVLSTSAVAQTPTPTPVPDPEDDEIIRVDTSLVSFPVSVVDRFGKFIPSLKKEDFKVFEDGVEQPIEYFKSVDEPFTVVLLIDRSDSVAPVIDDLKKAALAFIDQLRPNDRAIGVAFDRKAYILNTKVRDRETLKNSIQNLTTGTGTHLYATVEGIINRVFRGTPGRKALILFTDGQEAWSWDQPRGAKPTQTFETSIQTAEETGTQIFSIQFDSNFRTTEGDRYLKEIPKKTGGLYFKAEKLKDLNRVFGQIADELRFQYSIGYYPQNEGKSGERRKIGVTVNRQESTIRAKSEYVFTR